MFDTGNLNKYGLRGEKWKTAAVVMIFKLKLIKCQICVACVYDFYPPMLGLTFLIAQRININEFLVNQINFEYNAK